MNILTYNGYSARIDFDDEDEIFVGRIAGIDDVVGFHAETVDDLKAAFRDAVDDYLATCRAVGKPAQKPYSGKVMFRVSPDVHRRAALAAELSGTSLNQWAEDALDRAARTHTGTKRTGS
jgi:predicted HicB family RNase H-like nuclease